MNQKIFIILFSFTFLSAKAQQKDTLDNKTIMSLTKIGLSPQIIISKIKSSTSSFDVSVPSLIDLQSKGVNVDVINEMIKAHNAMDSVTVGDLNSANPADMHRPGIYYYDRSNSPGTLKRVDPTVVSTSHAGGFGTALAQHYTLGLAKDEIKSNLMGPKSHLQVEEENPAFYFYFTADGKANNDSWFFSTAITPNEFALVKLTRNKDNREMVIGDLNAYGGSAGVPNRIKLEFDYVEISDGIYKVTLKTSIKDGEYCFVYASATPSLYNNNKVFDFGVRDNK